MDTIKSFLRQHKLELLLLVLLFVVTVVPRLSNLGYSDYFGDETKILYLDKTQPAIEFFMSQRKAPMQFFVAWVVEKTTGGYFPGNMRLPFALAGVISVFVLYALLRRWFDYRVAFISTWLFSINGFYIAFSRFAQYQSLYILLGLLAILFATLFYQRGKNIWLTFSGVALGLAFLSHYDAVFFALPTVLILGFSGVFSKNGFIKFILSFLLPFLLILGSFYLPYLLQGYFEDNTAGYLSRRITGAAYNPNNSLYTAKVYNPLLLSFLPFLFAFFALRKSENDKKLLVLALWFLFPYLVFEFVFLNPGTHIHNYILPLIILSGVGIVSVFDWLRSKNYLWRQVFNVFLIFTLTICALFNIYLFIPEFKSEFPWKPLPLKFPGIFFTSIDNNYHLFLYGFPYNRNWNEIQKFMYAQKGVRGYDTNENNVTAKYYLLKYTLTPTSLIGDPQYYIEVYDNQQSKVVDPLFFKDYSMIKEIKDQNNTTVVVARIYKRVTPIITVTDAKLK